MIKRTAHRKKHSSGQALVEIAVFGAVLIFLIGTIVRSHVNTSFTQNYKVRAFKMALIQSYQAFQSDASNPNGKKPHTSRNSSNILFVEDRISPDLNKYNTLDRSPFIATSSATMSNLLYYPVDYDEFAQNIPIQDVYINGQHFEFTTAGFVFRTLYDQNYDCSRFEPQDIDPTTKISPQPYANGADPAEYDRCLRQQNEIDGGGVHTFFAIYANGTKDFDVTHQVGFYLRGVLAGKPVGAEDDPPDLLKPYMAWQWQKTVGAGYNPILDFGTADSKQYPSEDASGSLREQTIYYISPISKVMDPSTCPNMNDNDHLIPITTCSSIAYGLDMTNDASKFTGAIAAVASLDTQLGDIDASYDSNVIPGPAPGFTDEMQLYTNISPTGQGNNGRTSYLEIKESGLYDPINHAFVRSANSKDKTDLVSRVIQLSNDTGRMCRGPYEDGENNPVCPPEGCHCGDCLGSNFSVTCFEKNTRKLYVRSNLWDKNSRAWYTNVTKGL